LGLVGGLSVVEFGGGGVGRSGAGFGVFGVEGVFFGGEGEGLLANWFWWVVAGEGLLLWGGREFFRWPNRLCRSGLFIFLSASDLNLRWGLCL
jgi:hypothetical protein